MVHQILARWNITKELRCLQFWRAEMRSDMELTRRITDGIKSNAVLLTRVMLKWERREMVRVRRQVRSAVSSWTRSMYYELQVEFLNLSDTQVTEIIHLRKEVERAKTEAKLAKEELAILQKEAQGLKSHAAVAARLAVESSGLGLDRRRLSSDVIELQEMLTTAHAQLKAEQVPRQVRSHGKGETLGDKLEVDEVEVSPRSVRKPNQVEELEEALSRSLVEQEELEGAIEVILKTSI